jgi:hypothetical protein
MILQWRRSALAKKARLAIVIAEVSEGARFVISSRIARVQMGGGQAAQ